MKIHELKDSQYRLITGEDSKVFPSIYDVLGKLYRDGYRATFKLPISMEDFPSGTGTERLESQGPHKTPATP